MPLRFVRKLLSDLSTRNDYILRGPLTPSQPRSPSMPLILTFPVSILPLLSHPSLPSAHPRSAQTPPRVRSPSVPQADLLALQLRLFPRIDVPLSLTLLSVSSKTQLQTLDDHRYRVCGRKRHILERLFDKRWECQRLEVKVQ